MATSTLYHNTHFHVDDLVVLHIPPNLDTHLGKSMAWMEGISMYVLHPRLVRPFSCIHKICKMYVNLSMAADPCITSHTFLGMA